MIYSTALALDKLNVESKSVQIQKYSDVSLISDCKMLREWLTEESVPIKNERAKLGELGIIVWRCRIGQCGWQHGWSFTEAITKAISKAEKVS